MRIANYRDLAAISLPLPHIALPAGVEVMSRHGADDGMLSAARDLAPVLDGLASAAA
jgi:aspartyl-tRNA(Asn)/glutamyl-tRNA(Gln) amidotransferase subunit A